MVSGGGSKAHREAEYGAATVNAICASAVLSSSVEGSVGRLDQSLRRTAVSVVKAVERGKCAVGGKAEDSAITAGSTPL